MTVTLLFEDGPEATATFPVAAGARFDVPMAEAFPAAAGRRFSVLVEGAESVGEPGRRSRDLLARRRRDAHRRRGRRGDAPAVVGLDTLGSIAAGTRSACPAASFS